MAEMEQYWAVEWNSGKITVGRYLNPTQIEDAIGNPAILRVYGPFLAEHREAAKRHALRKLRPENV